MWIAAKRQIDADCDISADVDAFVRDIHAQADMLQIGKDREPFLRSVKGQLNLMVRIDAESATKCFTSFTAAFAE